MKKGLMRKQELAEKVNLRFDEVAELFSEETLESMYMVAIIGADGTNTHCGGAQCVTGCQNNCGGANCVAGCSGAGPVKQNGVLVGCTSGTQVGGGAGCIGSGGSGGSGSGSGSSGGASGGNG